MARCRHSILLAAAKLAATLSLVSTDALAEADLQARALLSPHNEAVLSSSISARIDQITVREGDSFKRGQMLIAFDCSIQRAQERKIRAELDAAQKSLDSQRRLAEMKSGSVLDVNLAESNVAKARADIGVMSATLSQCEIKAPFDGRVIERKAKQYQSVSANQPLLDILDDGNLDVEVLVPSHWLSWLKAGSKFSVRIEETGKDYPAHVVKLGARIDPASQTLKIMGQVNGRFPELISGMSGAAIFSGR
jgi:membrane fusion protein, multidrug efflux system